MTYILAIDDDPVSLLFIKEMMRKYESEYTLYIAEYPLLGLQLLEQHPEISVILLDIMMPDSDGFEVLEQINHMHPTCSVIFITAYSRKEILQRILHTHQVFDCIEKPINLNTLIRVIRQASDIATQKRSAEKEHVHNLLLKQMLHDSLQFIKKLNAS